jgi:hypothetical protein
MTLDQRWLEDAARIRSAQPLGSDLKDSRDDWKWHLGDYVLEHVPVALRDELAEAIGVNKSNLAGYVFTAKQWPSPERRATVSWTVHRDLAKLPDRFEVIHHGMSVRDAARARGRSIDQKADHRKTVEERAEQVERLLADPDVRAAVAAIERESAEARKARKAARQAEQSEARRLRDARQAARAAAAGQHPEAAFMKVHADLLEWEAHLRELLRIAEEELAGRGDGPTVIPAYRRTEFVRLLRTLGDVAYDGAEAMEHFDKPSNRGNVIDVHATEERVRLARLLASNS